MEFPSFSFICEYPISPASPIAQTDGGCVQLVFRIRCNKSRHHSRQLTSGSVIRPISGLPFPYDIAPLFICNQIDGTGNRNDTFLSFDRSFANATIPSGSPAKHGIRRIASTPLVVPPPFASVLISEIFPRMTSNRFLLSASGAVSVPDGLRLLPPDPEEQHGPAHLPCVRQRNIASILLLFKVLILILSPPRMDVISTTSSGSSDDRLAPGQQNIGDIIYRYIIRDVVNQRCFSLLTTVKLSSNISPLLK